jgi:uncharacterized membrane protein YoaK (UPF0700 family)
MSVTENQHLTGVRRVDIRGSSLQNTARMRERRAAGRALISGYVDSHTLLNFGVYASFMSCNTSTADSQAGLAKLALAVPRLLPIPFFVFGIFFGTLLVQSNPHPQLPQHSFLLAALPMFGMAAIYFAGCV